MKVKEYLIYTMKGYKKIPLARGTDRRGMILYREKLQKEFKHLTIHLETIWEQENTQ